MLIPFSELIQKFHLQKKIKGIFHIGAHECEELNDYLKEGIDSTKVQWFEANPQLVERQKLKNVNIHQMLASDVNDETVPFYITNNGQSSSMLQLGEHKTFYPHIVVNQTIQLKTKRMDAWLESAIVKNDIKNYNFLNLDIQGAELKALRGFGKYLDFFDYIYTEVNTGEVYMGCAQLKELDEFLRQKGFVREDIKMTDNKWGDAFYIRSLALKKEMGSFHTENVITGILVDGSFHERNWEALERGCKKYNIPLYKSHNIIQDASSEQFSQYNVIWLASNYISSVHFPPAKTIIYGPHLFVLPQGSLSCLTPEKDQEKNLHNNCLFLCPSQWVVDLYEEFGKLTIPTFAFPFSVNIEKFSPSYSYDDKKEKDTTFGLSTGPTHIEVVNAKNRINIFVYFKYRDESQLNYVLSILQPLTHINVKIFKYGSYQLEEYREYLKTAQFGIWIGCHESQGFALLESLSMNVPLLVWNVKSMYEEKTAWGEYPYLKYKSQNKQMKGTSIPYWTQNCGEVFYERDEFLPLFENLLKNYSRYSEVKPHEYFHYNPRVYIESELSDEKCMNRLFQLVSGLKTNNKNKSKPNLSSEPLINKNISTAQNKGPDNKWGKYHFDSKESISTFIKNFEPIVYKPQGLQITFSPKLDDEMKKEFISFLKTFHYSLKNQQNDTFVFSLLS